MMPWLLCDIISKPSTGTSSAAAQIRASTRPTCFCLWIRPSTRGSVSITRTCTLCTCTCIPAQSPACLTQTKISSGCFQVIPLGDRLLIPPNQISKSAAVASLLAVFLYRRLKPTIDPRIGWSFLTNDYDTRF